MKISSLLLLSAVTAMAAPDPAYLPIQDDPRLPRVLLIGDSISVGYTLEVRERLAGRANVHRTPENAATTTNGLARIDAWLGTNRWDVIHFNWGLHDLKVTARGGHFTPPGEYEKNLERLVTRMKATGAELIWATTTPVPFGKQEPLRRRGDEVIFNTIAGQVMERHQVRTNNLYALALVRSKQWQRPNNVHFTQAGSAGLADAVAAVIREALDRKTATKPTAAP